MGRYVSIAKESTFGVFETGGTFAPMEAVESLAADQNWVISDSIGQRARVKKSLGIWRIKGNVGELDIEPENVGDLLTGCLGSDDIGTVGGGYYRHTISPADTIPSYSMKIGLDSVIERRISGILIDSIRMSFTQGERARIQATCLSGFEETTDTPSAPSFSTLQPFMFHEAEIELEGSTITQKVYAGEVSVNNGLIDKGALGTRYMDTIRVGLRSVSGKLSMFFTDTTEFTRFKNGTEFSLTLTYTSGSYSFKVILPKCVYKADSVAHSRPITEALVMDASFEAFYDSDAGYEIQIQLINKQSLAY